MIGLLGVRRFYVHISDNTDGTRSLFVKEADEAEIDEYMDLDELADYISDETTYTAIEKKYLLTQVSLLKEKRFPEPRLSTTCSQPVDKV